MIRKVIRLCVLCFTLVFYISVQNCYASDEDYYERYGAIENFIKMGKEGIIVDTHISGNIVASESEVDNLYDRRVLEGELLGINLYKDLQVIKLVAIVDDALTPIMTRNDSSDIPNVSLMPLEVTLTKFSIPLTSDNNHDIRFFVLESAAENSNILFLNSYRRIHIDNGKLQNPALLETKNSKIPINVENAPIRIKKNSGLLDIVLFNESAQQLLFEVFIIASIENVDEYTDSLNKMLRNFRLQRVISANTLVESNHPLPNIAESCKGNTRFIPGFALLLAQSIDEKSRVEKRNMVLERVFLSNTVNLCQL